MIIKLIVFVGVMILMFGMVAYWLEYHNDPPTKGCDKARRHKWRFVHDHRSESSGYTGSVSLWKEFECTKCGKKEKTDTGVW